MNKSILLRSAGLIFLAFLFLVPQHIKAGDPGSQSADWSAVRCVPDCQYNKEVYDFSTRRTIDTCVTVQPVSDYCRNRYGFSRPIFERKRRQERQLAAGQMKNESGQTPGGELSSGNGPTRFGFSFFASVSVLIGGIWALFVLLLARFGKRRTSGVWAFVLRPSSALAVFAALFAATIVGGFLAVPKKVTAEKLWQKPDKSKMVGVTNPSNEPVFKSAQKIGGDLTTQIGAPVFDAAGNRYVRGIFSGNLQIGAATMQADAYDLFIAKYNADGVPLWARQGIGSSGPLATEGASAMALDADNNVYVGGVFVKQVTLQGGANQSVTLRDSGGGGVNYESFVAKYDANGNLLWARGGGSGSPQGNNNLDTGQNAISQIVFDAAGNPYVTGVVAGSNFLGSATVVAGQTDILLAKLDKTTGAVVWRQVIGGTAGDNGLDLKIDGNNNLYLIGNFGSPQITFPNGQTFNNLKGPNTTLKNSTNTFVAKFTQGGTNVWTRSLDNPSIVGGSQIAVNRAGEIIFTGYFLNSATLGDTTLTDTEGAGESASVLAGFLAKMDSDGNFVWAEGFGGIGQGLALDASGRAYVIGTFFDGGTFGEGTPNEETLASFGGQDVYVARYDADGNFDWAKPIVSSGFSGTSIAAEDGSENYYFPFGLAYNPARQTMFVSGDFTNSVALDCIAMNTASDMNHQSYLAELSADDEPVSCRVWNGLDAEDNNFDSPDNWNGGILPRPNDSVYVPYTGNDFDPPTYNPTTDKPFDNLVIADDRILTLEKSLTVNGRLSLLGGFIDAESFPLLLGASAQAFSSDDGLVLGKVQKQFAAGAGAFVFPVGTAAADFSPNYSPVTLSNIAGAGTFIVTANEGAYMNAAAGLPANRANRWWTLTNVGLTSADLTFKYVDADITAANESKYRLFKIDAGSASQQNTQIDVENNTATNTGVTQFSDWTLAVPTATTFSLSGRVLTPEGAGLKNATVSVIDANGVRRFVTTTSFGFYQIDGLILNAPYTGTVSSKRFRFVSRSIQAGSDQANVNFVGLE